MTSNKNFTRVIKTDNNLITYKLNVFESSPLLKNAFVRSEIKYSKIE